MRKEGYKDHDFTSKVCPRTVQNNLVEEPVCVFSKLLVSKNFMQENWGGRNYHDFQSKICCLKVSKTLAGGPFCVSKFFFYRETLWIKGGGRT